MSLTLIAVIGILVGFLCLVIGFFMEDAKGSQDIVLRERRGSKPARKKMVVPRKKAA